MAEASQNSERDRANETSVYAHSGRDDGFATNRLLAAADELNLRVGVTDISRQVYDLHMIIFLICVAIGVVVFGVLFWSVFKHRKSRGVEPATFHDSTKLELAWTIVPTIILIVMAIPATQVLIAMYDTGGEDMSIEVRGYQWKWQYKYLDDDYNNTLSFFSVMSTPRKKSITSL